MSTFAPQSSPLAEPNTAAQPAAPRSVSRRARKLLTSVPLVVISAIAMTFHFAAPAEASSPVKRLLKAKNATPDRAATAARAQVARAAVEAAPSTYAVVKGDTVSGIAARFGISTSSVLALNGLSGSALIFPGQVLTLSGSQATGAAAPAPQPAAASLGSHTVVSGDTISGIAAAHGLSVKAVLAANGLSTSSVIFPGQSIVLPAPGASSASPAAAVTAAPSVASTHTITSGDTISGIAARAGVSVQALLDANGLGWSSIIYPGQVLAIPAPGATASATVAPASLAPEPSRPADTELTPEMRVNAEIIISVGRSAGVSDYGLVIALAAAAQESGLRNVHYGDRDSLGLFQQRPSAGWGTPEQVLDPVRASHAFFGGAGNPNPGVTRGLLDIPGWESMTVTQAAQAVQISAYPDHYAKWEAPARTWLAQLS